MSVFAGLLSVIACLAAAALVGIVLLQEARSGGIAAMAGAAEPVFDTSTRPVRRLTSIVAGAWIASCTVLALLGG